MLVVYVQCINFHSIRLYLEVLSSKAPEYCEGNRALPVFPWISFNQKRLLSVEDTVKCLLHPAHKSSYLCQKTPVTVNHVIFLVDCSKLKHRKDIESDDLGTWRNNPVDSTMVSVSKSDHKVTKVIKCRRNEKPSSNKVFTLKRVYRVHGTDKSFRKITAYMFGKYLFSIMLQNYINLYAYTSKLMHRNIKGSDEFVCFNQ